MYSPSSPPRPEGPRISFKPISQSALPIRKSKKWHAYTHTHTETHTHNGAKQKKKRVLIVRYWVLVWSKLKPSSTWYQTPSHKDIQNRKRTNHPQLLSNTATQPSKASPPPPSLSLPLHRVQSTDTEVISSSWIITYQLFLLLANRTSDLNHVHRPRTHDASSPPSACPSNDVVHVYTSFASNTTALHTHTHTAVRRQQASRIGPRWLSQLRGVSILCNIYKTDRIVLLLILRL